MVADKPFVRGVARFARKPGRAGVNPGLAVQRYAAGQERFIGYMSTAKTHLDARGFRIMPRQLCLRLSQRLYRAFRKAYGDDVFALCVEPVAVAVRRGMTLEVALFVVRVSSGDKVQTRGLSVGMYFLRVTAGRSAVLRKLLVVE